MPTASRTSRTVPQDKEGPPALPQVLHQLPQSGREGVEQGTPHRELPSRVLRDQVPQELLGLPCQGERSAQVQGVFPGVDEEHLRGVAGEGAAEAGDGQCVAAGGAGVLEEQGGKTESAGGPG